MYLGVVNSVAEKLIIGRLFSLSHNRKRFEIKLNMKPVLKPISSLITEGVKDSKCHTFVGVDAPTLCDLGQVN